MKKKHFAIGISAIGIASLALTACSSGDTGAASEEARGPITIWYSNNAQEVQWGQATVDAWNAEHPDEQVKGQEIPAGKSGVEVIGAAIVAGTTPCLVFNNLPAATGQFQKQGGLVDLSSFPDGDSYIEARSGAASADQYRSADGDFYQLPWKSNPVMIFYNKDLFAKAGLDPENPNLSTYDEFLDSARAIVSSGVAPYAIYPSPTSEFFQPNFDFLPLYAAETGTSIIEDEVATIDSQAGLDVAEFWRTIYAEDLAGKEPAQADSFANGQSAMAIVGPWAIPVYEGKVNWGSVPVPTKDGTAPEQTYTFPDAKSVGMYTSCKNQGTAWDFLKFATSVEQDGKLLEATGQMPIRAGLSTEYASYFEEHPAYVAFASQSERTVDDPTGPNTIATLQTLRDFYTKAVISGEGDLQAELSQAADDLTAEWTRK
ncbi:sugar ABC transporter substrate-binding protein [Agromyces mediolanus]|uniref:ABC transporter substrate-binding protein n=1 Tax=Agromyces mediolanus TaxID=41986 RepID=UPI00203E4EE8|nr:sugar ABC transporter substrate-binding protein [Agromyces mediolanus]MCM3658182.1 sugar ABC transporter substrate-binding protein [Agromyces mediolanus]